MALGDEQIDRLTNNLKGIVQQAGDMFDDKIDQIRVLLNGIKINNTTTFDAPEVKKATPADQ
jgi:hypothetical protein